MNKRFLHIVLFFCVAVSINGQTLEFTGWSNNWLAVTNYEGAVAPSSNTFVFNYSGKNLNVENWSISMRITGPILSSGGKEFPFNKISLVPVKTEGTVNYPGPVPSLSQIGVPSSISLNGTQEVFLVYRSNAPLYHMPQNSQYFNLKIIYSLVVAGGAYLDDLIDHDNHYPEYIVPFEFKAYRGDNTAIGTFTSSFKIQISGKPDGTPPPDDKVFSIQVAASNALLEFNTINHYIEGNSVNYENGLSVTSNTNYEVKVHSIYDKFSSAGNELDLDVVKLQLDGANTNATNMPEISLSVNPKTILEGEYRGTCPKIWYHIFYGA